MIREAIDRILALDKPTIFSAVKFGDDLIRSDKQLYIVYKPEAPDVKVNTLQGFIEGNELSESEEELLAKRDGFKDFAEMIAFWRANNGLPFEGQIIHWRFDGKKNHDRRI